jgi:hypothetical protein
VREPAVALARLTWALATDALARLADSVKKLRHRDGA